MKHSIKFALVITSLVVSTSTWCVATTTGTALQPPETFQLKIDFTNRASGGEVIKGKVSVSPRPTEDLVLTLTSSKPNLARVDPEITIKAREEWIPFSITTFATVIKTSATIRVALKSTSQVFAQDDLELVPALINSVSLSAGSMLATKGSKLQGQIELRAPAPTGGIELYFSSLKITPGALTRVRWGPTNPRVEAGRTNTSFEFRYYDLVEDEHGNLTDPTGCFEARPRILEFLIAIDPTSPESVASPGLAHRLKIEFIPLRVVSMTLRPSTLSGGAEGTVTFALNAVPGPGEEAEFGPTLFGSLWLRPLGSSCQSDAGTGTIPLTGGPVYTLKACTNGPPNPRAKLFLKLRDRTFTLENFLQFPIRPNPLP